MAFYVTESQGTYECCGACFRPSVRSPSRGFRSLHDDVIRWKHFPRYWPFVWGFTGLRWIPSTEPVTRSFDIFFDLRPNKRLSKQSWGWWFETLLCPLWRQYDYIEEKKTNIWNHFIYGVGWLTHLSVNCWLNGGYASDWNYTVWEVMLAINVYTYTIALK